MEAKFLSSGKVSRRLFVSAILLIVGLAVLVAACGGAETATTSPGSATSTSTTLAVTTTTTTAATATSAASTSTTQAGPEIRITRDIPYMTQREGWDPPLLDVYAPKEAGPWPLVVMLHGATLNKTWLQAWAIKVARRGAVVFVPDWGRAISNYGSTITPATISGEELHAVLTGEIGDIAAIIRFARATGPSHGGDPENLTLFGHSGGANEALMEPFSAASASEGALEGAGSTMPESLVIFDADYLLAGDPMWDEWLVGEPTIMQVITPWSSFGRPVDFPITIIGSGDPNLSRELGDPWAEDSWLVARDPSGDIRRGLEKLGALEGDLITNESIEQLLVQQLQADGDKVTYVRLTGSTHTNLSTEGMESFLDALVPGAKP